MDGEVSSLLQALLIMAIATIALAGAITGIASKYNVQQSDEVNNIVGVMNQTVYTQADWGMTQRNQTTQNEWSNFYQLTSGTFSILANIMFSVPALFNTVIDAFVRALFVPFATYCTMDNPNCLDTFSYTISLAIKTIILLTMVFAAIKAITKVNL
jgi:hypothetical protein